MKPKLANVPASVLARLLKISRKNREDYQSLIIRYVAERFLDRLGKSEYVNDFILKGAYLLTLTLDRQEYRPTKDIHFLRVGPNDPAKTERELRNICAIQDDADGISFDVDSITVQKIREQNAYHGYRAKIPTLIGSARITLQIDVGIGDSVYPAPMLRSVSPLLDMDSPKILSYPIETVVAEPFFLLLCRKRCLSVCWATKRSESSGLHSRGNYGMITPILISARLSPASSSFPPPSGGRFRRRGIIGGCPRRAGHKQDTGIAKSPWAFTRNLWLLRKSGKITPSLQDPVGPKIRGVCQRWRLDFSLLTLIWVPL